MEHYEFGLLVEGVDLDAQEDAIAELDQRFDGLTWGQSDGQVTVAVEVGGDSLINAVLGAIEAVESVPGARVVRAGPEQYVSQAEIARRMGVSRQYVSLLAAGTRGPGGFPAPVHGAGRSAVWSWPMVADWLERAGLPGGGQRHDDDVFAAVNAALEARRAASTLSPAERSALSAVAA